MPDKIIRLVSAEERKNRKCYFCGETRSVKYAVKVFNPVEDEKPFEVACCNKCVVQFMKEEK